MAAAVNLAISYQEFFDFPSAKPTRASQCHAKCKICNKSYKYSLTTKGNLLKHLKLAHEQVLSQHKKAQEDRLKESASYQLTLDEVKSSSSLSSHREFRNQDHILTSLVRNLIGSGSLSIQMTETDWFRQFMRDVEPRFRPVSRVSVKRKLNSLFEDGRQQLNEEISEIDFKPSVTLDFWTGRDSRSFMGCTIHYIYNGILKSNMLFFKEVPPPHNHENIRNRFEDELDRCNVHSFQVVTDNASNMRCAFILSDEDTQANAEAIASIATDDDTIIEDDDDDSSIMEQHAILFWTPKPLRFNGWIGCACHQLQLVVHDGYKELLNYRRVQSVLHKAKLICSLSRKSSHFSYSLTARIPAPNDTRWNSYLRLHEHLLKHFDNIQDGLVKVNRKELMLSTSDKENLLKLVEVMQYFAEATDILQAEKEPTAGNVIPVIDSLENAVNGIERSNAAINALCECLLNSLKNRFSYLLDSAIHLAATTLDPRIKLTFTNNSSPGKYFKFNSIVVKDKVQSLLPDSTPAATPQSSHTPASDEQASKKRRLLDYCSLSSQVQNEALSPTSRLLQEYYDTPTVAVKPIIFWSQRENSALRTLALELFSVPSSSAPVERLFSKAGIILSQRRTRLNSSMLEQLLSFKFM